MKKVFVPVLALLLIGVSNACVAADSVDLWFAPSWKTKTHAAKTISYQLSRDSGVRIIPRVANGYPQILSEFKVGKATMVYAGSFVSAIIRATGLGDATIQGITGTEMYSGVMVYPKSDDPKAILKHDAKAIAFAVGASSGEGSARAATKGEATIKTKNHAATLAAVKSGKAKAGVVKNWWWLANQTRFSEFAMYEIPDVSVNKNADNVLTISNAVSTDVKRKIIAAAKKNKEAFNAQAVRDFDPTILDFTLSLMKKGGINPELYSW